jgi:hypothetical protein
MDTDEIWITVQIKSDVRRSVDELFRLHETDMPYCVNPDIVAEALNTLPDDLDLKILADVLAAGFTTNTSAESMPDSVIEMDGGKIAEPRPLDRAEQEGFRRYARKCSHTMRMLHQAIVERRVQPIKPTTE